MDAERYIAALEEKIAVMAIDSHMHPKGRDGFEYGQASGRIQGLQMALDLLNEQLSAADGKPRKQPVVFKRPSAMAALLDSHPLLPEEQ